MNGLTPNLREWFVNEKEVAVLCTALLFL